MEMLRKGHFWGRVLAIGTASALAFAGVSWADTLQADGDTLLPIGTPGSPSNPVVTDCSVPHTFTGALKISYSGGTHFASAASLSLTTSADSPLVASGPSTATLPTWDSNDDETTISGYSTTVPAGTPNGSYKVTYGASGPKSSNPSQTYSPDDFFNVEVNCPSGNTAPTVGDISGDASVNEGSSHTYGVVATDDDEDPLTYAWTVTSGNAAINGATDGSSVSVGFNDGPSNVELKVVVSDGTHAVTKTLSIVESNVAPSVAAPSFSATAVDCRSSVDLTGISFSDPGLVDNPWTVNIDWGDGSTDANYDAATQGAQSDQSHSFSAPGVYSADLDVTDKDGDTGSNSASVTVRQVYRVDFLPPFDDSTPSSLIVNTMKSGRTVPVKATIFDVCADAYVTSPAAVTIALSKASGTSGVTTDGVETYADAGASNGGTNVFRWSADATAPGGGIWIYNLDSRNAISGSPMVVNQLYRVNIYVGANVATASDWALLRAVK
jgi:hypothetical protein